ncbi:hypothetical protein SAMN05421842_103134 [Clostridium uliginosum]|uniref:Uncharacterized protein n=1 Tax=Clostridium uliginosum TaxID=119641 RepID=A0A1I1J8N3_9CLOT|nr:hypothetical protein SAMN05421842_103134 [Clostridium uliginosum]
MISNLGKEEIVCKAMKFILSDNYGNMAQIYADDTLLDNLIKYISSN